MEYHVEGTDTELSHFEILTNDTYIGTYSLTNSSFTNYSNCKFEKLADGWVKLTMNMPSTTRIAAAWNTLEKYPAITSLKGFTIHGSWGDHKPVSIRNIDFVKKEAVDLLESESLIKKVYIDKLDHNPQVIEEVKSGVSITKEESIVATKGYSWKVTANVNEEVWDWVVFGLDNPVDIETLENISLKFVNAQKWAMFRFYDEDFNLISDSISADFSSSEWNSFERTVFHTRNVKYVGVCLHFYPNVENVVYIDALNVTYMPETYFCENDKDTFIEMPKIKINSGKKLVLTLTNIVNKCNLL